MQPGGCKQVLRQTSQLGVALQLGDAALDCRQVAVLPLDHFPQEEIQGNVVQIGEFVGKTTRIGHGAPQVNGLGQAAGKPLVVFSDSAEQIQGLPAAAPVQGWATWRYAGSERCTILRSRLRDTTVLESLMADAPIAVGVHQKRAFAAASAQWNGPHQRNRIANGRVMAKQ